tara:strand:+ start:11537 stop:11689 length:153 start_codon:yes stop_codon:yes gene_type:complete
MREAHGARNDWKESPQRLPRLDAYPSEVADAASSFFATSTIATAIPAKRL